MFKHKFVLSVLLIGGFVGVTRGKLARVWGVSPKEIGTGGALGGATLTITGRYFASEFTGINTFSTDGDYNSDNELGNHVYLVTLKNGKTTSRTKCPVNKLASKTTGKPQKLLCNPLPKDLKENEKYCVKVKVVHPGKTPRWVTGNNLCGGKRYWDAKCCFETKWKFTPTISALAPNTLTPAEDMSIKITGKIFTTRYGGAVSSNGRSEEIVSITVGPARCDLKKDVDANGNSYAVSLYENSDEGYMICEPTEKFIGCANVSYTIDQQMGSAVANGDLHQITWDGKSCMLLLYPVVTNVSINQGSKLGGQVMRIFSPNADLGGTADSTISAAKCFIGETEGQVVGCMKNEYCDCLVGPEPETWTQNCHIGQYGPTVEVWDDGTHATLEDILNAPRTDNTFHFDVSRFCNHEINFNQTRMTGLFYAFEDGVYVFEMRASFCGKFYFEDAGNNILQGESRGHWAKGDYWRLEGNTHYKITIVAGGPSCNSARSAAVNPCVELRAKYYGDDTDKDFVMSTGDFTPEVQILRIRSEQIPESQRIEFNVGPVVEPVYEVQKICRKSDSNTRARFKLGAYTGFHTVMFEDEGQLKALENALNDELLTLGRDVTVTLERQINPLCATATFISSRGGFPLLEVDGDRITVTRITAGKPDNTMVSLMFNNRPSTPIPTQDIADPAGGGVAVVQGAVDSLFTAWCPKKLWKNSVFSEDFEGEQSDYYPGAVDKEQGAFCGRQSMRNAWRLYPINRAKTGRISMKRNLYVNFAYRGITDDARIRVLYEDRISGVQSAATILFSSYQDPDTEHTWEYTSVDLSGYKEENRQLVDIRIYGKYRRWYWVDALSITTSPTFATPSDTDGDGEINYYNIESMIVPPASPHPGGKVRVKDVVVTAAEEGGYLITYYPFNCGRGFDLIGIMNGQEKENNGNTKTESLKGGDINVTTTRVTTASARAAGTVELEFTRQENTAFRTPAPQQQEATRKLTKKQQKRRERMRQQELAKVRRTININADILAIKRQMESISSVNRLLVELSKGSTCANKDIMFTFLTRQGSQNLLKIISSNLTPNGMTTATIIRHVEGHLPMDKIWGDKFKTCSDKPQVQLYINDVPSVCTGDCSYQWTDDATPTMSSVEIVPAGESATGDGSKSVAGIVGSSLRIYGTQFSESPQDNVASLGGFPCNVFESSGTWIDCTVTAGVGYDLPITVKVAGLGFADGDLYFSYTAGVLSFEPTSGSFGGGQEFTISGWGFPLNAEVLIDGQICTRNSWTETDINCIVPASSVTYHGGDRTVDVEVQIPTSDGPITKSSTDSYNYTVEQTGVINESLSDLPTTTDISGGDSMAFTGIRFGSSQQLRIGHAIAASKSVSESEDFTTVTFETPPDLAHEAEHAICLYIDDFGCAVLETGGLPKVSVPLRVDNISPRELSLYGGTTMYIDGGGFVSNLDAIDVTIGDYRCVPVDVTAERITCELEYTSHVKSVTNMGDGLNGPYFSCDPQTTLLATGDTVRFEWYSPELEWNSPNTDSLEYEDDEEAEVTWSYTMNQTTGIDRPANMENGISCGESTPAGSCDITLTDPSTYYFWSGYLDIWQNMYYTCTVEVSERLPWAAEVIVNVAGREPSYSSNLLESNTNSNDNSQTSSSAGQVCPYVPDTCQGLTSEMLSCTVPGGLETTNPERPSIIHHACTTPVVTGISFPTSLTDYPRGVTVSTEIQLTGTGFPDEACAITVTFGTEDDVCGCEIVGSPNVDNKFEGTFRCRPELACLQHVGLRREMHVKVKGLGFALLRVPYNEKFFQILYSATAITPTVGAVAGGTAVTIQSSGGFHQANTIDVRFNTSAAQCSVFDDTSISCISPPSEYLDSGTAKIEITTNGYPAVCQLENGGACSFDYELDISPVISEVSLLSIDTMSPTSVTIAGENFGTTINDLEVTIGGQDCTVNDLNANISCTLRGLPAGDNTVEVLVKGIGKAMAKQTIEGIPDLYSLEPARGSIYGGTPVTLNGHGFLADHTFIDINGNPCSLNEDEPITLSTAICVTHPASQAGTFPVETFVQQSFDNYAQFPNLNFTYSMAATPQVYDNSPTEGIGDEPLSVKLTLPDIDTLQSFGLDFDSNWTLNSNSDWTDVFKISLGGVECAISDTAFPEIPNVELTCTIGDRLSGQVDGSVHVKGIGYSNNFQFTYNMVLGSVDPALGSTQGGQLMRLEGTGFLREEISVTICEEECILLSDRSSATELYCVTPTVNAEGPCSVRVVDGVLDVTLADGFTYHQNLGPWIESMESEQIPSGESVSVRIRGTGFGTEEGTIIVNGNTCAPVADGWTSTTIECLISSSRYRSGPVEVQVTVTSTIGTGDLGNITTFQIELTAFYEQPQWTVTQRWSSQCTWKHSDPTIDGCGELPMEGEIVVIQDNQNVIFDVESTPVLKLVLITGGTLTFAHGARQLNAENILIADGGTLLIGDETNPFDGYAEIVAHGNHRSTELPIYGTKGLFLREGYLGLHGKGPTRSSTYLSAPAIEGEYFIRVPYSDVSDWFNSDKPPGSNKIVIATTADYTSHNQTEEHTIVELVQDGDDARITLDRPLAYNHSATVEEYTAADGTIRQVKFKAVVIHLSRNIVIRGNTINDGADDEPCNFEAEAGETDTCQKTFDEIGFDNFGAIMMIHGANENSTLDVKIQNVEFSDVGQAYRTARNPVNFHMTDDMTGSYIKGCSFRDSHNRAIVLNGANNLEVRDNVAYDIDASAFFIGDSTGNTFDGNVVLNVKSISGGLNSDFTAAAFLISNPDNVLTNNLAAGCDSHGFWFNLAVHPTGPSFDETICPQNIPLGNFSGNTAYANGGYGVWTFETYTPQIDGSIAPTNGVCQQKRYKAMKASFNEITAWNNFVGVALVKGSGLRVENSILVQNNLANFRGVTSFTAPKISYSLPETEVTDDSLSEKFYGLSNSVIVGRTHSEELWQLNQGVNGYTEIGMAIPFGYGVGAEDTAFVNFGQGTHALKWTKIRENYIAYSGYPFWVLRLKFENVYQKGIFSRTYEAVVHDVDNSLECSTGPAKILPNLTILTEDSYTTCSSFDNSLIEAISVPYSMRFHQFSFDVIHPKYLYTLENKAMFSRDNQSMAATHSFRREGPFGRGYSVTLPDGGEPIELRFDGPEIQNISLKIVATDYQSGDCNIIEWAADKKPDRFSYDCGKNLIHEKEDGDLECPSANHGEWQFDQENKRLRFAIAANDTMRLRRSITGYSDDIYICLTMYKCYFDGCVPPPPEDDIIPSSVRVDGCVRANSANGVRWRENPDNPQEVISMIESAEESTESTATTNTTLEPPTFVDTIPENSDITVAKGHCIVMCPGYLPDRIRTLKLLGVMEFADDVSDCGEVPFNYNLKASNVIIQGGRLIVGRQDNPFEGHFDLEISGGRDNPPYVDPYTRSPLNDAQNILGVIGGLDLHGRNRTMRTNLLATVNPGDSVLRLEDTSNWNVGDTIIISPTGYDPYEIEERKILSINTETNAVTVDTPLTYTHLVTTETVSSTEEYQFSAVVGSITSNIKLRSDVDEHNEGFGAYLLVTVGQESSGHKKTFTGFARLSYVEFINFGRQDYGEAPNVRSALTFLWTNKRAAKPHDVKGCSFYYSYSTAIGIYASDGIGISDNVVYGASGNAIKVASSGTQLLHNLVALVRWPGTIYYRNNLHGAVHALGARSLRLQGNVVTGSTGAAYRVLPSTSGPSCTNTICYNDDTGNVAMASSMGWVHFPTDPITHQGVSHVSGFKFWKITQMAVYYNGANSVQFSCLVFADNGLDIFPMVYGPSAVEHKVEDKFVRVCDSMHVGYSSTMDCDRDIVPTGDFTSYFHTCSAPKGEDDSRYSIIFAQFIQGINHAQMGENTCTGFTQYMSLKGRMEISGVTFMNYDEHRNCPALVPLATNPTNEDFQHPVYTSDIQMINVPEGGRLDIQSPDLSKVRGSEVRQTRAVHSLEKTCGDMVCSGKLTVVVTDGDGTLTGNKGSVTSSGEDNWNNPAWGRGDDKIPRPMLTDSNGRRKSVDDIRTYTGLGRTKNAVKKAFKHKQNQQNEQIKKFFYTTPQIEYVVLVIESLDEDSETRRLGPVAIRVTMPDEDSYLEILNEPEDHYYCSGYLCGKRLSTYFAPVPDIRGVRVDIYMSGTSPERTRFFLMRPGTDSSLLISFFLTNSMRTDVYCEEGIERHYPKCTRRLDDDRLIYENKPESECMPVPDDGACANYINREKRLLYFNMNGNAIIILKRAKIVVVVLWLPDIKLENFYDQDNLIRNLAALLGVQANKVRIVKAVSSGSGGNRRRRQAESGMELQIEVGDEPPPTAYEDTTEASINEGDQGDAETPQEEIVLDPQQQIADTLMVACQDTTIVQSLGLDGISCEAVETEEATYVPAVPQTLEILTGLVPQHEGVPFATQPKLRAIDSLGEVIDDLGIKQNTWQMTARLRKDTGHPDAALSGITTISSVDGWFNFTNLTISHAGEGYVIEFEITYPPTAAALRLNTTSAMFDVSAIPLEARLYAMTNGDIIENTEFSVTFELQDSFTGQTIEDINWRGHTFNIDCGLPEFTDFSTIAGNVPKVFDSVTGRVELDELSLSGYGLNFIECHVTSSPAEFDFLFYQKVYVVGFSQLDLSRDVSDVITIRFKDEFDEVLHSDALIAQLEQMLLQEFAKSHPYIVLLDSSVYRGSIMVTFTAEGSLGNVTALKHDICGVIWDQKTYTLGSSTLTLDNYLEVDGQEYFDTLCVTEDKDETLHPGYIALIAVVGLILVVGVVLFVCWKVHVKPKTKPHVPGQYRVYNNYPRTEPEIFNIKFGGVQKHGMKRQSSNPTDAPDNGKTVYLGGGKDNIFREATLDDDIQSQNTLYNSDLQLDLRATPYLRRIMTADSGLELPGTPNLSRTASSTSGLDNLYNDDPLTPRDIITLTPTAD